MTRVTPNGRTLFWKSEEDFPLDVLEEWKEILFEDLEETSSEDIYFYCSSDSEKEVVRKEWLDIIERMIRKGWWTPGLNTDEDDFYRYYDLTLGSDNRKHSTYGFEEFIDDCRFWTTKAPVGYFLKLVQLDESENEIPGTEWEGEWDEETQNYNWKKVGE